MTTAATTDLALMAHLLRRAGFGSDRAELMRYAERNYEDVVEDLLNPDRFDEPEEEVLTRYYPHLHANIDNPSVWNGRWFYRMVNTDRPLEEKMTLFWHGVFATGWTKSEHTPTIVDHIQMLRTNCLENFRTLLLGISRDPAMIFWLDNNENHGTAINENYGREILELFSMGIGNYTEDDIKSAARAFTGWTYEQPVPLYPYGQRSVKYRFRDDDHDDGEKTFLGHTGNFDGGDIIDIIARHEATARFISRHLYNFFVADEAQVPAWSIEPPADPTAIDDLVETWMESDADIRAVLRTLFNSNWFKVARYKHIKSPTEFVAGVLKLSGEYSEPGPDLHKLEATTIAMGQKLMDPPSVEGWHTGKEWIDGGTLTERVNYAIDTLNHPEKPGVKAMVDYIRSAGDSTTPDQLVDHLLELVGPLEVEPETREAMIADAATEGSLDWSSSAADEISTARVVQMLTLVVATREFQFA
ncbi:MAG: DUF1800 domain-containing protein [Gammaproteobacteria bacterium]|nr:DUF1800 domain-containing protein [Gammaproteobacteria bacterium]